MATPEINIPSFEELFEQVRRHAEIAQGIEARAALNILAKLMGFNPEKIREMDRCIDALADEIQSIKTKVDRLWETHEQGIESTIPD